LVRIDLGNLSQDEHGEQPAAAAAGTEPVPPTDAPPAAEPSVESVQRAIRAAGSDAAGVEIKQENIEHSTVNNSARETVNLVDSDSDSNSDERPNEAILPEMAAAAVSAPAKKKKKRKKGTAAEQRTGHTKRTKPRAPAWEAEELNALKAIVSSEQGPPQSTSDWENLATRFRASGPWSKRTGSSLRSRWNKREEVSAGNGAGE
jgi:hypothetical protein